MARFSPKSRWLFVAGLLLLPRGLGVAGEEIRPDEGARAIFREVSPVSAEFRGRLHAAVGEVPAGIWRRLEEAGWRFRSAEFLVDAVPALKGIRPRGWPLGATWENTEAVHVPEARLLAVAEKKRTLQGQVVASTRTEGVLRHELGHAVDIACGGAWAYRSGSPRFAAAYAQDRGSLREGQAVRLAYYLQPGEAGRQETFAEAFGILLGGGSDPAQQAAFQAAFPQVLSCVAEAIDECAGKADAPR